MSDRLADVVGRLRHAFSFLYAGDDGEEIEEPPRECPHCDLPVMQSVLKDEDEPVAVNWYCPYCGNGATRGRLRRMDGE